ncbi:MAG TPA: recombinase family protein [Ruminiclostridium sp.]|nr:recombinase family protein [Ruminiclostridium sp.]
MIAIYAQQTQNDPQAEKQIEYCLRKCTGEYAPFIDEQVNAKNKERPAMQSLIHAVERGEIDKVVVYRIDVMFNTLTEFSHLWQILHQSNTEFTAVSENFDTSTQKGKEILEIMMEFAKIERENIGNRIRDNYRERAKKGIYPGGPAPYGFDIGRTLIGGNKASILVPNDNIIVVKEIFELYAAGGISLGKLAAHLHEKGVPGIKRSGWDNVSISRILHNPVYVKSDANLYDYFTRKGISIYNDKEQFSGKGCWLLGKRAQGQSENENGSELLVIACHDGVISSDVFLKCQKRLDANRKLKNTGNGAYTWLSGLVKCGYCGYSMQAVSSNGGKYVYLICTGKTNFKVCRTKFRSPHVETVEPYVEEMLNERLNELKTARKNKSEENVQIDKLKGELRDIEKQISNLLDNLASANDVLTGYINARVKELDSRKNEIVNYLKNNFERARSMELPSSDFSSLAFEQKKEVAKALINKISLTKGKIDIEWSQV